MLTCEDIRIRDPFILPVPAEGAYYLYGTVGGVTDADGVYRPHFVTYRTADLVHFGEPQEVFRAGNGFWADRDFWAPEVHRYRGRYYMFASFKAEGKCRGTQILVSDTPDGTFVPLTEEPVTPRGWECLDGTLYVDPDGRPWIVFCHEWVQIGDGTVCTMPLTDDLTAAAGEPVVLFHGSEAPGVEAGKHDYVTDGPFVLPLDDGTLGMLWSSFLPGTGYAQLLAKSEHGITGPWVQQTTPVFVSDGGHGMLFRTFGGQTVLTLHAPNRAPEHPKFFPVMIQNGTVSVQERKEFFSC